MLLFLFAVIVISFSEKKKTEFLFAAGGTVHYGSGTVQKQNFCFLKGNDVLNRTSGNH